MPIQGGRHDHLIPRRPQEVIEELDALKKIEDVLLSESKDTASYRFRLRSVEKMRLTLKEELYAAYLLASENEDTTA